MISLLGRRREGITFGGAEHVVEQGIGYGKAEPCRTASGEAAGLPEPGSSNPLKAHLQADVATASGPDGVTAEQPGKVNYIQPVAQVFHVALKTHGDAIAFIEINAQGSVERKLRPHAPVGQIHTRHHRWTVLCQSFLHRGLAQTCLSMSAVLGGNGGAELGKRRHKRRVCASLRLPY